MSACTRHAPAVAAAIATLALGLAGSLPVAQADDDAALDVAMHYSQDQAKPLLDCFRRYEEQGGQPVRYRQLSYSDYLQTVVTSRLGGQPPDIYHLYSIWAPMLVDNGVLAEPPASIVDTVRQGYAPSAVDGVTIADAIRGVPSEVSAYLLVSNMALLKEAGFDAPPTSFDELRTIAKAVTRRNDQGKIEQAGFAFAESSSGAGLVHPFYARMAAASTPVYADDFSETGLAGDAAVSSLEDFRSLIEQGITDRSVDGYDFPAGGIGMIIMANWLEADIRAGFGDAFDESVRVSPLPFGDDWKTLQYTFFFGVDSNSDQSEAAWQLIDYINGPESAAEPGGASCMAVMLDGIGALTANTHDLAALPEPDAFTAPFVEAIESGRTVNQPNVMQAAEIERLMADTIDGVITGRRDARTALRGLDEQVLYILSEFH